MPTRPSVQVTHRQFTAQTDRLRALVPPMRALAPEYRVLIAEMITLQAFYFFELAIEDIAAKLICGARYGDGVTPAITNGAQSIEDALNNMRTVGRRKIKGILKWNKAKEINGNVRHIMASTESFCTVCRNHSARLNEIRIVRNHIAHGNQGTRNEFSRVVQRRLGALPQRLPRAGAFVLREPTPGTPLVIEYVVTLGVIVKDAAKL